VRKFLPNKHKILHPNLITTKEKKKERSEKTKKKKKKVKLEKRLGDIEF
jgi:hypothetical protein